MIHLIADNTPLVILSRVSEEIVLYDTTGTLVIGHITPTDLERGKRIYAEVNARIDSQEMARRAAEPGPRRPVCEIIKELEAMNSGDVPPGVPSLQATELPRSGESATP